MAITFSLVEVTPYRLRYLATQDGVISSPPVAADGFNTIPNANGATPDLGTDIATATGAGAGGIPLNPIIDAGRNGYKQVAAGALTQAGARALLNSDDNAGAFLTNHHVGRAVITVTPRTPATVNWAVDANVDGNANPTIEVRSETGTAATAYVDLHMRHSDDL